MNGADFHKDRPSLQLLGKEFIIVVVVIFSALSFTLGYFVGKSGIDGKPADLSRAPEITPMPQQQEPETLPRPQNGADTENTPVQGESAEGHNQPQQRVTAVSVPAEEASPAKSLQTAEEKTGVRTMGQPLKENDQKPDDQGSSLSQEGKKTGEPVYTVQIGAFKNSSEAETFRKKQSGNGLKTYITTSTNKTKDKIYKVKTGEFRDRKSAELLSLKLNKTGKLKTYVTLKSE